MGLEHSQVPLMACRKTRVCGQGGRFAAATDQGYPQVIGANRTASKRKRHFSTLPLKLTDGVKVLIMLYRETGREISLYCEGIVELKFKAGDRVVRQGDSGPLGTVQRVRIETSRSTIKEGGQEPPGITVTVLWDNGTTSHFVPESLDLAQV